MGIFDSLLGNASEVDIDKIETELSNILTNGEHVDRAYSVFRDLFVFTSKRLIMVDKQGVSGKKVEYHSVPYKSVTHFSVETAGHFDMDSELKIWISGTATPISKQFGKNSNINHVQQALATYVLK